MKRCRNDGSAAKVLELRVARGEKRPNELGFCDGVAGQPHGCLLSRKFACCKATHLEDIFRAITIRLKRYLKRVEVFEHSDGILTEFSCLYKHVEIMFRI